MKKSTELIIINNSSDIALSFYCKNCKTINNYMLTKDMVGKKHTFRCTRCGLEDDDND